VADASPPMYIPALSNAEDQPVHSPEILPPDQRSERGKAARAAAPRSSHGEWEAHAARPDPVAVLEAQAPSRVAELLPIRYGRMAGSPLAFFRGAAAIMARDLASTPTSAITVQLCGDAHLSNFGGFATPERDLIFDLNDFDETAPGPWEWDLKRLAASVEIAGRGRGFARRQRRAAVRRTVREYRLAMGRFAGMRNLEIWYSRMEEGAIGARLRAQAGAREIRSLQRSAAKGRAKDNLRAYARLAHEVDGVPRGGDAPPLIVRIEELLTPSAAELFRGQIDALMSSYRETLQGDRRRLLERYRVVDIARRVVGVGSVGTRAWMVLLLGRDDRDPLFMQCKEAQPSVLESVLGDAGFSNHGQRVVEGQRLMQASSDTTLGWVRGPEIEGETRDYYLRQLWDWKTTVDVESMVPEGMEIYGRMCGWTLARAHARSGDSIAIAAYLGHSDRFDRAIARFAGAYADQNERDHRALREAIAAGRITARPHA
jgi:uncharacterized protein (DUF2252 family)